MVTKYVPSSKPSKINGLVTVITCTGHRPEAFSLCAHMLKMQTYRGPVQWLVVHDEKGDFFSGAAEARQHLHLTSNISLEVHRGPRAWEPELNTQRFNMEEALKHVRGEKVLIFEDEDYYSPRFIETYVQLLDLVTIVGEGNSKYYHVGVPGFKEHRNFAHASLCQTGFNAAALPLLKAAIDSGELYFDIHFWRQVHEKRISSLLFQNLQLGVGIKGMPGRAGISPGHRVKDYFVDPGYVKLREWLGADADNYLPFLRRLNSAGSAGKQASARVPEVAKRAGAETLKPSVQTSQPKEHHGSTQNRYTLRYNEPRAEPFIGPAGDSRTKAGR